MLYAAKCFWPGVSETELEQVAARAAESRSRHARDGVDYLGSLLFSDDALVLCLFAGPHGRRSSTPANAPAFPASGS